MLRLLHTADWQIGRAYTTFDPEQAPLLAEARMATVARLAALAQQEGCDAVLVAGDVFDAQTVSDRTVRRLFQSLEAFAGPWLMLPGNHDAALAESVWTRAQRLGCVPAHVHLLLQPEPWIDADRGLAVMPAPLRQRHTSTDLTDWWDTTDTPQGLHRIGLAHGSVQGLLAEDIDSTNPIAPDRAERARLDYLALGDWHGCKRIDARTWYAGTPEPDRFKDNGPGHVLRVELAHPGAEPGVTPLPVAQHQWHRWTEQLRVPSDATALVQRLASLDARDVLSLELSGRLDLVSHGQLMAAIGQAEARLRALLCDSADLGLAPTDDDLARLQAEGYVGELLTELRQTQAEGEGTEARRASDALALLADALQAVSVGGAAMAAGEEGRA